MNKRRILFIESEGGHGGSSRSLHAMIKSLNSTIFYSTVVCRKKSKFSEELKKNKNKYYIFENIPKFTSVRREKINIYSILKFYLYDWIKSHKIRKKILNLSYNYDYVHFNHINLFLLAKWMRKKNRSSIFTMHIRTNPYFNFTSRIQARIASNYIDKFIFITENEHNNFAGLLKKKNVKGSIIHNIIEKKKYISDQYQYLNNKNSFNIGIVSNYSYIRGTDRFIEVIKKLKKITKREFLFIIAGDNRLSNYDKTKLNIKGSSITNLKELAKENKISDHCIFLGHINNPEDLYPHLNLLIKPTRDNNPWGRDILEAMIHKIPVISVGTYKKFVNNKTGLLMDKFDAEKCAIFINKIINNKALSKKLGNHAENTIQLFCSSNACKKQYEEFWS